MLIKNDFAWAENGHPIVEAYRAFQAMPYDAPTHALIALLHAVRAEEDYWKLSEAGTITVGDDGSTKLTPSADGKHRKLMLDPERTADIVKVLTELVSAKPPEPRSRRGRRG